MKPSTACLQPDRYGELYRVETSEHLAIIDASLLKLEQQDTRYDLGDCIATIFRSAHTIKGMAAAMGFRPAENVAHAMESLLEAVRAETVQVSPHVLDLLFDGSAMLASCITENQHDLHQSKSEAIRELQRKIDVAIAGTIDVATPGTIDIAAAGTIKVATALTSDESVSKPTHQVVVRLTEDCPLKGVRAILVLARIEQLGSVLTLEPSSDAMQQNEFDGVFTILINSGAGEAHLEQAILAAGDVKSVAVSKPATAGRTYDRKESIRHVRIDVRRLDVMLDLVSELAITRDRLVDMIAAQDGKEIGRDLGRVSLDASRLVTALQVEIAQARMVPVASVFDRYPRLVRDIARDLGKEVHFALEGREIEIDRSLLDAIGDPILHLLRNALDHGLEEAASRIAACKPAAGRLVLRARRDRSAIVIEVEDDGRGIDRAKVAERARARGIISDQSIPDDSRLLDILSHPGFSTANSVGALSGRGVGVDVVASSVNTMGGTFALRTTPGAGSVFTLRLPASIAMMRALLVQVDDETYALPAEKVVEIAADDDSSIRAARSSGSIELRGELIHVRSLRHEFGLSDHEGENHYAIVEVGGQRLALAVDSISAHKDIVVKNLDTVRGSARWFSGATILGDGKPALIVDPRSLI